MKVIPGSPAEKAGLQPGDVLYALNGVRIAQENYTALTKARKEWTPGQSVTYTIKREGVDREIALTLAPMPADVMARWIGEHMKEHEAAERAAAK
jgi:S1-C subfamily serine protease